MFLFPKYPSKRRDENTPQTAIQDQNKGRTLPSMDMTRGINDYYSSSLGSDSDDDPFGFIERCRQKEEEKTMRESRATSMATLYPRKSSLTFHFEIDFVASVEREEFIKTGKKTVKDMFIERFKGLGLCGARGYGANVKISAKGGEKGSNYVEDDTDITDERPVWIEEGIHPNFLF
jgi:hypothetical protein